MNSSVFIVNVKYLALSMYIYIVWTAVDGKGEAHLIRSCRSSKYIAQRRSTTGNCFSAWRGFISIKRERPTFYV